MRSLLLVVFWAVAEAGQDYTVSIKAGEVSDTSGNPVIAGDLGAVNITVLNDVIEPPAESIRIEAEDYKAGMNGVAYLDTSRGNFGGAHIVTIMSI